MVRRRARKNIPRCARKSSCGRNRRTASSCCPYSSKPPARCDSVFWAEARRWCSLALLSDNFVGDGARVERKSAVIADAAQLGDQLGFELQPHELEQLAVAVLIHDVDAFMIADEILQTLREWISEQPQVTGVNGVLGAKLIAAFANRIIRGTGSDETDAGFLAAIHDGQRDVPAHHLEFVGEAVHVVDVIVLALGILRFLVVAAAAREIRCGAMVGAGQRAIADS